MHIQKEEMDSARWAELEQLVRNTQVYLHDFVHPQKSRFELTEEGTKLFEWFKSDPSAAPQIVATIERDTKKYFAELTFQF